MPQGLRDLASSWHVGEGVAGLTQMQAVAAAAGAVVLLYAGLLDLHSNFSLSEPLPCMAQFFW